MTRNPDFMSLSRQEILDLGKPTPEYEELMKVWPPMNIDWTDRNAAVAKIRDLTLLAEEMDEPEPDVEEETLMAPARDGHENRVHVFREKNSSALGPLIVLYHGGGCVVGSPIDVAQTARQLVKRFHAVVVAPAYRLAPEHPFPTSNNDTWDSFQWIAKNAATTLRADPSKEFIVGGISAGGTMSTVIAHLARDTGLQPELTGVWSACGSARCRDIGNLDPKYRERLLSREQDECINNPVMSKDLGKLMRSCYNPDDKSELYAPLLWPYGQGHKNLPRFYQQVCGRDLFRDEAFIFQDLLKSQGVKTRLDLYKGLPHCFWIPLKHLPEYKRWERETLEGFAWLLGRE